MGVSPGLPCVQCAFPALQEYVNSNSSKLKLQESSLFGSSGSDKFPPDTSAADIIKQMKPERSSPASLLPKKDKPIMTILISASQFTAADCQAVR